MPRPEATHRAIRWSTFDAPLGRTFAAASERGLCRLTWHIRDEDAFTIALARRYPGREIHRDPDGFESIGRELREYFAGERRGFDIPIDLSGSTRFERSVLEATRRVPFGSTVSYSELARRVGRPNAARAVGNALRNNPVPIIIPCHRVIRTDGSLGGYGGPAGTAEKDHLLRLEAVDRGATPLP